MSKILFLLLGTTILTLGGVVAGEPYPDFRRDSTTQNCNKNPAEYEAYIIKSLRVSTNFLIFPARADVSRLLGMAQEKLKNRRENVLEERGLFTESGYLNLQVQLNNDLRDLLFASSGGFVVIKPRIFNCDDQLKEVEVEYVIFGAPLSPKSYVKGAFELPKLYFNKRRAIVSQVENSFQLVPIFGYNESRGLFGGVKVGKNFEHSKLVNKFDFSSDFSSSSFTLNTALAGSQHFKYSLFDYANWRVRYSYSKLPAATLTLTESTFSVQFFGATRPMQAGNTIIRYGTAIEAGNRMINLDENVLPSSNIKSSGYAATKVYVGGSSTWNNHSLKASYGIQLGNTGKDFQINYLKSIFDAAYRGRFLLTDHKPLQIDAQLCSGKINLIYGNIPAAERFFGGMWKGILYKGIRGESEATRLFEVFRKIVLTVLVREVIQLGETVFCRETLLSLFQFGISN